MEGCFIDEGIDMSRCEADRILRGYKRMDSILRSSSSYGRHLGNEEDIDEAAIHAQMYSMRSCVLSIENPRERMFLYHYYIKGATLKTCSKLLGVSMRTVCRIKNSALKSIYPLIKLKTDV